MTTRDDIGTLLAGIVVAIGLMVVIAVGVAMLAPGVESAPGEPPVYMLPSVCRNIHIHRFETADAVCYVSGCGDSMHCMEKLRKED